MSSFGPGRITSVNIMNYAGTTQGSAENCIFNIINNTTPVTVNITSTYSFAASTILNFVLGTPLTVNLNDTLTISVIFPVMVTFPVALRMRVVATITLP